MASSAVSKQQPKEVSKTSHDGGAMVEEKEASAKASASVSVALISLLSSCLQLSRQASI